MLHAGLLSAGLPGAARFDESKPHFPGEGPRRSGATAIFCGVNGYGFGICDTAMTPCTLGMVTGLHAWTMSRTQVGSDLLGRGQWGLGASVVAASLFPFDVVLYCTALQIITTSSRRPCNATLFSLTHSLTRPLMSTLSRHKDTQTQLFPAQPAPLCCALRQKGCTAHSRSFYTPPLTEKPIFPPFLLVLLHTSRLYQRADCCSVRVIRGRWQL